jgi:protein TonB
MPVYASTPSFADHRRHPRALMFIVGGHAVLIAAVMTAKMDVIPRMDATKTIVDLIEAPKPPPPPSPPETIPEPRQQVQPQSSQLDRPTPIREIPISNGPEIALVKLPPLPTPGPIGTGAELTPSKPVLDPVRVAAVFNTPDHLLRPPYPTDKQRLEEEGTLKLRLTIDERGRVIGVEPVGSVDRSFFESARKHLLAKWRYKPATVDGRPVASSTVITLRFELET